jgi:hypothetical protein
MQALQSPATCETIISEMVRGGTVQFDTRYPINDPLVSQIVSTLVHQTESDFLDHILVDALNTALGVRMVRHFVVPAKFAPAPPTGCHAKSCNVRNYIEAHLGRPAELGGSRRGSVSEPLPF